MRRTYGKFKRCLANGYCCFSPGILLSPPVELGPDAVSPPAEQQNYRVAQFTRVSDPAARQSWHEHKQLSGLVLELWTYSIFQYRRSTPVAISVRYFKQVQLMSGGVEDALAPALSLNRKGGRLCRCRRM